MKSGSVGHISHRPIHLARSRHRNSIYGGSKFDPEVCVGSRNVGLPTSVLTPVVLDTEAEGVQSLSEIFMNIPRDPLLIRISEFVSRYGRCRKMPYSFYLTTGTVSSILVPTAPPRHVNNKHLLRCYTKMRLGCTLANPIIDLSNPATRSN